MAVHDRNETSAVRLPPNFLYAPLLLNDCYIEIAFPVAVEIATLMCNKCDPAGRIAGFFYSYLHPLLLPLFQTSTETSSVKGVIYFSTLVIFVPCKPSPPISPFGLKKNA